LERAVRLLHRVKDTTMPNHCISPDLKECALCLWEIGWSIEDICFVLGVSRSSLYRWQAIFNDLGTVTRPPSPLRGPTQILTHALLTACQDLFAQDSDLYIDEVITWLALVHNIEISPTTLRHNLEECQVRVYSGRGSGQVRTKANEGEGQRAGQGISPARVETDWIQ